MQRGLDSRRKYFTQEVGYETDTLCDGFDREKKIMYTFMYHTTGASVSKGNQ